MKKLVIASQNAAKIKEFAEFLSDLPLEIVSLTDLAITDDVEEDGETYEANSQKKALFYAHKSGLPAISDDGGLEIAALNGEPGVKTKRWLGYEATQEELMNNMRKVALALPENNRQAQFRTVVTVALPDGRFWSVEGKSVGIIAREPYKNALNGYPYRAFFFLPDINKYHHKDELTAEEQKKYNHRLIAIEKLKGVIAKEIIPE